MRRPALLYLVLLVSACGDPPIGEGGAPAAERAAAVGAAAPAAADSAAADPKRSAAPVPAVMLAVDGEGLRLVDTRRGAARPLAFGLPAVAVLGPVEALRGAGEGGRNADCGADQVRWTDGLTLVFRGGNFAGWALDGRAQGAITTMSGIGPGSPRSELEGAYAIAVKPSSLGIEFAAGGLAGLLGGPGADARVTDLWAGSVCLAR